VSPIYIDTIYGTSGFSLAQDLDKYKIINKKGCKYNTSCYNNYIT